VPQYALHDHVFVCADGEHVVFLDIRADRYFSLDGNQARALSGLVRGWHELCAATDSVSESPPPEEIAHALLEKGLLCPGTERGKAAAPVRVPEVTSELVADDLEAPELRAPVIASFLRASLRAAIALRFLPLHRVVHRVRKRNTAHAQGSSDPQYVHELIVQFVTLQPLLFAAKNRCLFESLALSEFLAAHRCYPRWVFGVQTRPFAAHCWLQCESAVLNDTVDHVTSYTPIMAV